MEKIPKGLYACSYVIDFVPSSIGKNITNSPLRDKIINNKKYLGYEEKNAYFLCVLEFEINLFFIYLILCHLFFSLYGHQLRIFF